MATDLTTDPQAVPEVPVRRRRRQGILLATVVIAVSLGAVAGQQGGRGSPGRVGPEGRAPGFNLARVGAPQERVSLADFSGRPVVVNFWASWCVPCRKEMPALQAVSERLRGSVAFVGVNHQDGKTAAAKFQQEVGVSYPSGSDPSGDVGRRFGVAGLPTTVLVDADGNIVGRRLGEVTEQGLLELIERGFGSASVGKPS